MRLIAGMLGCIGACTIALADPPPATPTQPAASGFTASLASDAIPPKPVASAPHETTTAIDPREKSLRLKGYRQEMRHGEKMYCRNEEVLGSRLAGRKVCGTVEELQQRETCLGI